MEYSFTYLGHENITGTHKTTFEFTKDKSLSLKGNCIIGVRADFSLDSIKKFIKNSKTNNVIIQIQTINNNKRIVEQINAKLNPNFNSDKEIVVRKSDFLDLRTFAIKANKSSFDLDRAFVGILKKSCPIAVKIDNIPKK
jgi:uncharacterized protein